jgi:hypothetical protein
MIYNGNSVRLQRCDAIEITKVLILELAFLSLDSSSDKRHGEGVGHLFWHQFLCLDFMCEN